MTNYSVSYTTYEDIYTFLEKPNAGDSASNPVVNEYADFNNFMAMAIPAWSRWLSHQTAQSFVPIKETKTEYFDDLRDERRLYTSRNRGDWTYVVPQSLLVLSSLSWNDTTVSASDYRVLPSNRVPIRRLRIQSSAVTYPSDWGKSIDIDGTWCFHQSLSDAYTDVSADSSVTIGGNSTDTTLTVSASSAYEILQYIRLEDELMQVTAKPSTTTLTVKRAVNGTSLASHSGVQVEQFHVHETVRLIINRLVSWSYQTRGITGNTVRFTGNTVQLDKMPNFLMPLLDQLTQMTAIVSTV